MKTLELTDAELDTLVHALTFTMVTLIPANSSETQRKAEDVTLSCRQYFNGKRFPLILLVQRINELRAPDPAPVTPGAE